MKFDIEIILPSGKVRRVKEIDNRSYLTICKFAENGDYKGLNLFFEDLCLDADLNIFDRFYLLIYLRMMFVDDKIVINKGQRKIDVSLASVLNRLEANYKDYETTFIEGGYTITLDIPNQSYFHTVDELLTACIKTIDDGMNTLEFCELSESDKTLVLENLPMAVFTRIQHYIKAVSNGLMDITLIDANESIGVEQFSIDLIGNGVMEFITSIFSTSLESFYELVYIFSNTITPGSDIFFELSPVESKILLNQHNKRVKEENEQLQKQEKR